jgi:lipoate-protein ligase A
MAVDAALLALAGAPTLRFYGWRPHAVSIGWFQRCSEFADLPTGVPIVRRATGGGAIHHGDELTFALAVDADRLPGDVAASYRAIHAAVRRALAAIGVSCEQVERGAPPSARPCERWCFAVPGRDDLVTERGKLCGSAQRRERTRVLHHGSLVLERPPLTPFVGAVADQVALDDAVLQALRTHTANEIGDLLGESAQPGELRLDERALAERLAAEPYGDPAHLARR